MLMLLLLQFLFLVIFIELVVGCESLLNEKYPYEKIAPNPKRERKILAKIEKPNRTDSLSFSYPLQCTSNVIKNGISVK